MSTPSLSGLVVALLIGGVVGAAGGAFVGREMREPELEVLRERLAEVEAETVDARREAGEWRAVADAERLRTQAARERLSHLETQSRAKPIPDGTSGTAGTSGTSGMGGGNTTDSGNGGAGHGNMSGGEGEMAPPRASHDIDPEMWDRPRLNMEIEFIAARPQELSIKSPRFERVLRAIEAMPDRGSDLLGKILKSSLGDHMKLTAAALIAAARTPECGPALIPLFETATDERYRRRLLSAIARGDGSDQTEFLVGIWENKAATPSDRAIAGTGLGLRAHPIAIGVATAETKSTPPLRARMLEGLYRRAYESAWAAEELIPVFRKALVTADGPGQMNVAMGALEGYWTDEALPELDAIAAKSGLEPKLRQRARAATDGIRDGRARPPGLGELDLLGRRVRQRARHTPIAPAPGERGEQGTQDDAR